MSEARESLFASTESTHALCACGHSRDWHSHVGMGDCEHDGDCGCKAFRRMPLHEALPRIVELATQAVADLDQLRADALREESRGVAALEEYGWHKIDPVCDAIKVPPAGPCTCGFEKVLHHGVSGADLLHQLAGLESVRRCNDPMPTGDGTQLCDLWPDHDGPHVNAETSSEWKNRLSSEDRLRLWRGMGNDPDALPENLSDADLHAMVARFTSNA